MRFERQFNVSPFSFLMKKESLAEKGINNPKKERKKERKRERKKEREKERNEKGRE